MLQDGLGGEHVEALFAFFVGHFDGEEVGLGGQGAEPLVGVTEGQAGESGGPVAEFADVAGHASFFSAHVDGEADHEADDGIFLDETAEGAGILIAGTAGIVLDGGGDGLFAIADREAETFRAEVDSEEGSAVGEGIGRRRGSFRGRIHSLAVPGVRRVRGWRFHHRGGR